MSLLLNFFIIIFFLGRYVRKIEPCTARSYYGRLLQILETDVRLLLD